MDRRPRRIIVHHRYDAMSSLARAELDVGSINQATLMLRQVEDSATRIDHPISRSRAFSQTVEALIALDRLTNRSESQTW